MLNHKNSIAEDEKMKTKFLQFAVRPLIQTFIVICGLNLSAMTLAQTEKPSFRDGFEIGCAQSASKRGNSAEDTQKFCKCFTDTLLSGMTKEEEKQIVAGDKKTEMKIMLRNADKIGICEQGLSKDFKF